MAPSLGYVLRLTLPPRNCLGGSMRVLRADISDNRSSRYSFFPEVNGAGRCKQGHGPKETAQKKEVISKDIKN